MNLTADNRAREQAEADGYEAYRMGVEKRDNPFRRSLVSVADENRIEKWESWRRGWLRAERDSQPFVEDAND